MSPCLVQQLFRQKIGKELDVSLFEEVLFPILRQKECPRELLLDIKMTQSFNDLGQSAIIQVSRGGYPRTVSPFTKTGVGSLIRSTRLGTRTSKKRRVFSARRSWGSIDILNELRNLKHPHIGDNSLSNSEDQGGHPTIGLDNSFIRLEEDKRPVFHRATRIRRQGQRRSEVQRQKVTLNFVNDYLEDCLNTDWKRLSWGGDPNVDSFQKILSTHY